MLVINHYNLLRKKMSTLTQKQKKLSVDDTNVNLNRQPRIGKSKS